MSGTPIRVIPAKRTEMRIDDMMIIGAAAYTDVFKRQGMVYELATAASQWTTECGIKPGTSIYKDGGKVIYHIWNNNWGNITCRADADMDKHVFTTKERIKKGVVESEDVWKELKMYFKAYSNPREGAIDYWKKMQKFFPKSLKSFTSGDMNEVAVTLSKEGYYTDLVSRYKKNLDYYFPRYFNLLTVGKEALCTSQIF
jgi:hypothetical protein